MRNNELNDIMDFDHVVRVDAEGNVTDAKGDWAPSLHDGQLDSEGWTLMNGYSGQDRYAGPIMHASEYVGGQMAEDILATPGLYVTLVDYPTDGDEPDGWAVAHRDDSGED